MQFLPFSIIVTTTKRTPSSQTKAQLIMVSSIVSTMDLEKNSWIQQLEEFKKPTCENTLHLKHSTYDKLEDGLIALGTGVAGEHIIIGKQHPPDSEELSQRTQTHACQDVAPLNAILSPFDSASATTWTRTETFISLSNTLAAMPPYSTCLMSELQVLPEEILLPQAASESLHLPSTTPSSVSRWRPKTVSNSHSLHM